MTRRKTVRIASVDLSRRIKQKEAAWLNRKVGDNIMRFCLVAIMIWIGCTRFAATETASSASVVGQSPAFSWIHDTLSPRVLSALLGVLEIAIAVVIALGAKFRRFSIIGSLLAAILFATTITCMLMVSGVFEETSGGFLVPSVRTGQFLINDVALFGTSISLLFSSWSRDD
ncbi:MAG: putative membrane protein YkgB [Planctomycetota bacterium]|jgi:uncharacterized membrane protein YkgB